MNYPLTHTGKSAVRRWLFVSASHGVWLVAERASSVWALAPPSTFLWGPERDSDLCYWRAGTWAAQDLHDVTVTTTSPAGDTLTVLSTKEAIDAVPHTHHEWIKRTMRRQLSMVLAFPEPEPGSSLHEVRAHSAAKRTQALRAELREAFPGEEWYEPPTPTIPRIPDYPMALLEPQRQHAIREWHIPN